MDGLKMMKFHEDGSFEAFVPLLKFDETTGEGEGILAIEEPDQSGEIMDYETSKSAVLEWSDGFKKATEGKSAGNLRVMHTNKVAGRFIEVSADDTLKGFPVKFTITDPVEKRHAANGDYTGLSVGGRYAKRWEDETNTELVRYSIGKVAEGSLVDNPCIPSARFTLKAATGEELQKRFRAATKQFWFCGDDACMKRHEKREDALACSSSPEDPEDMGKMSAKERNSLPDSDFAIPSERKYPIQDEAHARDALARVSANGTPEEKAKVRAAVKRKYPNMDVGGDKAAEPEMVKGEQLEPIYAPVLAELAELKKAIESLRVPQSNGSNSYKENTMADEAKKEEVKEPATATKTESKEDLSKAQESEFTKALNAFSAKLDAISKRQDGTDEQIGTLVKFIGKLPGAPKGVYRAVGKAEDGKGEGEGQVKKTTDPLDVMKSALDTPKPIMNLAP